MLGEHGVHNADEGLIAVEEAVAAGEEVPLQPALAHVLGEHGVHHPAAVGQVLVPVGALGVPHPSGGLEHGGQAVGLALVRAEDPEVLGILVLPDHIPDKGAQYQHVLGLHGAGGGQVDAVVAEVGEFQVPQQLAAVGVGVGPHPPVPLGGQGLEFGAELALLGEELLGVVAAQPVLHQLQVVGLGHVDGHLVGPEGALNGLPVHFLGAGPALGGAQDDHGPGGAAVVPGGAGVGLDALDLPDGPVQGGGHGLVHLLRVAALDEAGFPAAAPEEALQLAVGDAGEDGGVVDLKPIEVEDGEHGPVPDGV